MTIREQMLPIGTRVRHLKGFPGDDQRTYPAGIEGLIVSHGSLGYHGISFVFEDIEATFLFLADEVEVLPVISAEETLRAELEATRKTLTEVEGRARRYAEERDAAQSALTVRYAMRREIEAKLGMVSGEANDESLRRGLEAIRALEAEGVRWCDLAAAETVRADKAERDITASRAEVERLTRERDEIDALAQRYSDEALAASPALAGQGLNAGMMVAVARAEKAERERDDARADRDEAEGKRDVAQQERNEAWSSLASTQAQLDLLSVRHQRRETLLEAADATEGEEVAVEALVDDLHFSMYHDGVYICLTPSCNDDGDGTWTDEQMKVEADHFCTVEECVAFLRGIKYMRDAAKAAASKKGLPR